VIFPLLAHCCEGPLFQRTTVPKVRVRDRVRVSRVKFRVMVTVYG